MEIVTKVFGYLALTLFVSFYIVLFISYKVEKPFMQRILEGMSFAMGCSIIIYIFMAIFTSLR